MADGPLQLDTVEPQYDKTLDPGLRRTDEPLKFAADPCDSADVFSDCRGTETYASQCETDTDCQESEVCEAGIVEVEQCSQDAVCQNALRVLPRCVVRETLNCGDEISELDHRHFCGHNEEAQLGAHCGQGALSGQSSGDCIQEVVQLRCGSFFSIACVRIGH